MIKMSLSLLQKNNADEKVYNCNIPPLIYVEIGFTDYRKNIS